MIHTMEKEEFNQLCADIMCYKAFDLDLLYDRLYDPYENLNHIDDVVEKLIPYHHEKYDELVCPLTIAAHGFRLAIRDFVISAGTAYQQEKS